MEFVYDALRKPPVTNRRASGNERFPVGRGRGNAALAAGFVRIDVEFQVPAIREARS